jgi:hypothetical protein
MGEKPPPMFTALNSWNDALLETSEGGMPSVMVRRSLASSDGPNDLCGSTSLTERRLILADLLGRGPDATFFAAALPPLRHRLQDMHPELQRRQLPLGIAQDQRHEGLVVVHRLHPAGHLGNLCPPRGGPAVPAATARRQGLLRL